MKTDKFTQILLEQGKKFQLEDEYDKNPVSDDWLLTVLRNNPNRELWKMSDTYHHNIKVFLNNPDRSVIKNWQELKYISKDKNGLIYIGENQFT